MEMAQRRLVPLLVVLALPLAATPASAALQAPAVLPPDLPPQMAVATVAGLAAAPRVAALPAVHRHTRYGTPGTNRMRARVAGGVIFHGLEGADRLYGASGSDQLFGDTGPDAILGGGGTDLIDG